MSMEKMIDTAIEIGRIETALKMEWVELAFHETEDEDMAFVEMFKLQKDGK